MIVRKSALEPRQARMNSKHAQTPLRVARWRFYAVGIFLLVLVLVLFVHLAKLQVWPNTEKGFEFLQGQGESRTLRTETIPAYRGVITDRNGDPLAVSTPVSDLWANPKQLMKAPERYAELAKALSISTKDLTARLARYSKKEFMYLQRQMPPDIAKTILDLEIPGVYEQVEYHRYYPAGDVAAHLVGMTDVDDRGQEGMELAYDSWLTGVDGEKDVIKDLRGRVVKELKSTAARSGQGLTLSIDLRLQYLAHRELKNAIDTSQAAAGTLVILDVLTGEILAMTNWPSYNPNDRSSARGSGIRNRAITDLYEPGSTVKPWVILAALESGKFKPTDVIDTNPGYFMVGTKPIKDHQNYGAMDLAMTIAKSSNIAMTKISFALDTNTVRDMYSRLGVGQAIGTGLKPAQKIERANLSYGYALTLTPLQVVQAYSVIASGGIKRPLSLLKVDSSPTGERIVKKEHADQVVEMLTRVVSAEGTGSRAKALSYSVAGKTGTAFKAMNGKYTAKQISSFIGMAPVKNPRIVALIVIDDPQGTGITANGGWVAAPAFSRVAEDALRMLQVPPDKISENNATAIVKKDDKLITENKNKRSSG